MKLITLVLFAMLAGCTQVVNRPAMEYGDQDTIPVCSSPEECEAMWSAARQWVKNNSVKLIEHDGKEIIATYNPELTTQKTTVRVVKQETGKEQYRFVISVWCGRLLGCFKKSFDAEQDFNRHLAASRSGYAAAAELDYAPTEQDGVRPHETGQDAPAQADAVTPKVAETKALGAAQPASEEQTVAARSGLTPAQTAPGVAIRDEGETAQSVQQAAIQPVTRQRRSAENKQAAPKKSGEFSYYAQRSALSMNCSLKVELVEKKYQHELYSAECEKGKSLLITCERQDCMSLMLLSPL